MKNLFSRGNCDLILSGNFRSFANVFRRLSAHSACFLDCLVCTARPAAEATLSWSALLGQLSLAVVALDDEDRPGGLLDALVVQALQSFVLGDLFPIDLLSLDLFLSAICSSQRSVLFLLALQCLWLTPWMTPWMTVVAMILLLIQIRDLILSGNFRSFSLDLFCQRLSSSSLIARSVCSAQSAAEATLSLFVCTAQSAAEAIPSLVREVA